MTAKGYFEVSLKLKLSAKLSCLVLSRSHCEHAMGSDYVHHCSAPMSFLKHTSLGFGLTLCLVCRQLTTSQTSAQLSSCLRLAGRLPLIARFSTVVHESGSPESLRDTRGFSIKFYTNEGNWDFVGNNMPVSLLLLSHSAVALQITLQYKCCFLCLLSAALRALIVQSQCK